MSYITLRGWGKRKEKSRHSMKSSVVIAFVATILLWWLPIFGPMISGYVSGRASGSKYMGLISTAIVAGIIGISSMIFTYIVPVPTYVTAYLGSTIVSQIHTVSPYGAWLITTVGVLFTSFSSYLTFFPPNWAVLIAFGFLGGAMSELLVRDTERKSVLAPRHRGHNDASALSPKEVDYEPVQKPHPLIRKIMKHKQAEESQDDYI
jgi:hypothetical protein